MIGEVSKDVADALGFSASGGHWLEVLTPMDHLQKLV